MTIFLNIFLSLQRSSLTSCVSLVCVTAGVSPGTDGQCGDIGDTGDQGGRGRDMGSWGHSHMVTWSSVEREITPCILSSLHCLTLPHTSHTSPKHSFHLPAYGDMLRAFRKSLCLDKVDMYSACGFEKCRLTFVIETLHIS